VAGATRLSEVWAAQRIRPRLHIERHRIVDWDERQVVNLARRLNDANPVVQLVEGDHLDRIAADRWHIDRVGGGVPGRRNLERLHDIGARAVNLHDALLADAGTWFAPLRVTVRETVPVAFAGE
jgi:hypothetical protein